MNLIDEKNSRDKLSNTLVYVPVDNLIDLTSQLLSNLSLLGLHNLTHKTHEVIASLRLGIGHIEVMESDILDNLLLLVDVSLGKRYIFFSFKVEFTGV